MKDRWTRRSFIRHAVAASAGLGAHGLVSPLNRIAHAQTPGVPDRYYIFCYFNGGWDGLLGLDPRDPRVFSDGNLGTTGIQTGYDRLAAAYQDQIDLGSGRFVGPYFGELGRHFEDVAIVRGMTMETLTHEVGRRRFLTGVAPTGLTARGSSVATWLAAQQSGSEPIPNLAVRTESYNADLPSTATALKANSINDLLQALREAEPRLAPDLANRIDSLLSRVAECPTPQRSAAWMTADSARRRALEMTSQELDTLFDFQASTPEMDSIRALYGIGASGASALETPQARGAMAVRALVGGVSRCVTVQVAEGLDTHYDDWASEHGPTLMGGFDVVAHMIDELKSIEYGTSGGSWFDHTTIVGFSEFNRTPVLNVRGGRDHSLTNSCFLAGADIKGGSIVGRSSDVGMNPTGIDLDTGDPAPNAVPPRPENIWQALYELNGLTDEPDLRVGPLRAMLR